jgi:RNA:NAD 2'-phosphotransferase (TPT1/KptA family)
MVKNKIVIKESVANSMIKYTIVFMQQENQITIHEFIPSKMIH